MSKVSAVRGSRSKKPLRLRLSLAVALSTMQVTDGFFLLPPRFCGRSSLVVLVTDSWPVYVGFQPSTPEDTPCREAMYDKSV
ncbi:hypothetical protein TNCV_3129701 [Trichonephila clavipes]|nr:hypothetical protein TNCV_3129701 [Trichonephila clavipes]